MARREPIDIALGERRFTIRALTIDQMQAIEAALQTSRERTDVLPFASTVLKAALARDHSEDAGKLGEIECDMADVKSALQAVLRHGGFLQGEAAAAAVANAPIGAGSADASPPASG